MTRFGSPYTAHGNVPQVNSASMYLPRYMLSYFQKRYWHSSVLSDCFFPSFIFFFWLQHISSRAFNFFWQGHSGDVAPQTRGNISRDSINLSKKEPKLVFYFSYQPFRLHMVSLHKNKHLIPVDYAADGHGEHSTMSKIYRIKEKNVTQRSSLTCYIAADRTARLWLSLVGAALIRFINRIRKYALNIYLLILRCVIIFRKQ